MKSYNKPVVEFAGIEVKDVITTSGYGSGLDANSKSAFNEFTSTYSVDPGTEFLSFEW